MYRCIIAVIFQIRQYTFCFILFYYMLYFVTIRFFYRYYRGIYTIYVYCYTMRYQILFPLLCQGFCLLKGIGPQVYTKEYVIYVIQLYGGNHTYIIITSYDTTILYGYKIVIFCAGYPHHFIHVHADLFLFIQMLYVKHLIIPKNTCYPPRIQILTMLVYIRNTLPTIILQCHDATVYRYHITIRNITYYVGIFCYLFYLPMYTRLYFPYIVIRCKGIVITKFTTYDIITTTTATMYYFTEYVHILLFIHLVLTSYFPAKFSNRWRICANYPILIVCAPIRIHFYYLLLVFLCTQHYCRIMVQAICKVWQLYQHMFAIKCNWSLIPPYPAAFYDIMVFNGYMLSGYYLFGEGLYGRK
ncbi:p360_10L [African swine fever virus]|uniref:p360_10L n=1 Tax=African swine fever virus TaxID=10497 RepID=A0A8A1UJ38_ASF|nr:p360_10L [African swine fever virus]